MPKRAEGARRPRQPEPRPTAAARGYDRRWRRRRMDQLTEHPLCAACEREGRVVLASVVDHIIPHEGQADPLFWAASNLQSLCKRHHDLKTARSR